MSTPAIVERLRLACGIDSATLGSTGIDRPVRRRMEATGVANLAEYEALLAHSPAEIEQLIEEVVVPETWFFREPEAFRTLTDWVQKEWLPRSSGRILRLLSVPCSTGEEPYSIAIALLEAGCSREGFTVDAIDISSRAIDAASRGVFHARAFRTAIGSVRERYFTETADGFLVQPAVRERVRFRRESLLDLDPQANRYDVVFCRNLLIYLGITAREKAVQTLAGLLPTGGLLFVGPAEVFLLKGDTFAPLQRPRAFSLRRVEGKTAVLPPRAPRARRPPGSGAARTQRPVQRPRRSLPPDQVPITAVGGLDRAEQLANEGQLNEAMDLCKQHLREHGSSARGYSLLGLLLDARNEPNEAVAAFRRALYLEPDHTEALLHLALLLRRMGNLEQARRLEERARFAPGAHPGGITGEKRGE